MSLRSRLLSIWALLFFLSAAPALRILTRYIVFDLLKVFLMSLVCMTAFVFVVMIGKLAVDNGLGLVPLIKALPFILPQAMQFAVPGTMLLATVTVYGRVAASNEVVAVKSMGISPMALLWPTLILATLVSFAAVVLNDVAVSWGRGGVQRVLLESLEEIVYGRLRTTRSYSNEQLKVGVKRVEQRRLIQPLFSFYAKKGEPAWTITADEAEIRANPAEGSVSLILVNADMDLGGKGNVSHPGTFQHDVSLADFTGQDGRSRSISQYALREIGPSKIEQKALIGQLKQEMTATAACALMTGRTFELSQDSWHQKHAMHSGAVGDLYRLNTEPHRRWAGGFSCLCFVMIGAPMAIRLRHGEIWGSFFACFLPILLVYYPMLVGCLDMAKDGVLPAPAVWLGNVVLAGWGVWLLRRVIRF